MWSFYWSYNCLKLICQLNSENIDVDFNSNKMQFFHLALSETPILIWASESKEKLYIKCKSAILKINNYEFEKIILLKTKEKDEDSSDLIFIPFYSISNLILSELKNMSSSTIFSEMPEELKTEGFAKTDGFIFSLKSLSHTQFDYRNAIIDSINSNQVISNESLKVSRVNCEIKYSNDFSKLKNMFPDHFYDFNYYYRNYCSEMTEEDMLVNLFRELDLNLLKLSEITILFKLSTERLNFIWMLLNSDKARFTLLYLDLQFSLLSEWLHILSLCTYWQELKSITFVYYEADLEDEQTAVDIAIREFTAKLESLKVLKYQMLKMKNNLSIFLYPSQYHLKIKSHIDLQYMQI